PVFCFFLAKVVRHFPRLSALIFTVAVPLMITYCVEVLIVLIRGVLGARALIGPLYFLLHVALTFSAAPALACVLLLGRRSFASWWLLAAAICWVVGAGSIFYQYDVAETLYGIDGLGGPYHWPW
ncbi:MAG TPA: hypothetical protein VNZ06_06200, partial [Steroidobacteraceae bacterium]|nr:hypothetical protein [Steroidobacteraceae bacterium]